MALKPPDAIAHGMQRAKRRFRPVTCDQVAARAQSDGYLSRTGQIIARKLYSAKTPSE